jgi:hypothetical protein
MPARAGGRYMRIVWLMLRAGICGDSGFTSLETAIVDGKIFFLGKLYVDGLFYKNDNGKKI